MSLPIKSRNLGRYGLVNFTRALGQGGYFILAIMKYRYRSETQLCFAIAIIMMIIKQTNKHGQPRLSLNLRSWQSLQNHLIHFQDLGLGLKIFLSPSFMFSPDSLDFCYVPVVQLLPRQMCDERHKHINVQRYTCKKIGGQSLPRITIIIVLSGYVHLLEFILGLQRCIESTWS